jgi:hypothetical protein
MGAAASAGEAIDVCRRSTLAVSPALRPGCSRRPLPARVQVVRLCNMIPADGSHFVFVSRARAQNVVNSCGVHHMAAKTVGDALAVLQKGLRPLVEEEMRRVYADRWVEMVRASDPSAPAKGGLDVKVLLTAISSNWQSVFKRRLSGRDRAYVGELREVRNQWAHQEPFSESECRRALDTVRLFLNSIGAVEHAREVEALLREMAADEGPLQGKRVGRVPPAVDPGASESQKTTAEVRDHVSHKVAPLLGGTLAEIVACLNDTRIRATYGAVAAVAGGIAQSIGGRLGMRRPEASWVVNAATRLPSGYRREELHPELGCNSRIITTGKELEQHLRSWRSSRSHGGRA